MSRKYENYQKYYQQSPRGRYTTHRANSLRRGLDWEFTFEEWWQVWKDSGKWEQRGKSADSYCMARINDEGPYCADNVVITTMTENSRQACDAGSGNDSRCRGGDRPRLCVVAGRRQLPADSALGARHGWRHRVRVGYRADERAEAYHGHL